MMRKPTLLPEDAIDGGNFTVVGVKCSNRAPYVRFDNLPHTHVAVDDALEQGALFCNMLSEGRKR